MKKLITFLMMLTMMTVFIGCDINDKYIPDETEDAIPDETEDNTPDESEDTFDLKTLKYYDNLSDLNPVIMIEVQDYGIMEAQLFPSIAPNTVNNFIDYILDESFSDSGFHRIIETFMIQGGIVRDTKKPIAGEFTTNGFNNTLKHTYGVLSMARTSNPNSATSQFFIMHALSPHLDGAYASFGGLVSGFEVLDAIATTPTNYLDAPLNSVVIISIQIELNGYEPEPVIYYQP